MLNLASYSGSLKQQLYNKKKRWQLKLSQVPHKTTIFLENIFVLWNSKKFQWKLVSLQYNYKHLRAMLNTACQGSQSICYFPTCYEEDRCNTGVSLSRCNMLTLHYKACTKHFARLMKSVSIVPVQQLLGPNFMKCGMKEKTTTVVQASERWMLFSAENTRHLLSNTYHLPLSIHCIVAGWSLAPGIVALANFVIALLQTDTIRRLTLTQICKVYLHSHVQRKIAWQTEAENKF